MEIISVESFLIQEAKSKLIHILREAMGVPVPTGDIAQKMKEQGIYVLQNILRRMPYTTQKDMYAKIQDVVQSGVSDFFKNLDAKTVIQLPQIFVVAPENIFEFNNKKYFAIEIEPPRIVGKAWKGLDGKPYVKGQLYEGEVLALDIDSGLPVPLSLPQVREKIKAPLKDKEQTLEKVNREIVSYNERIKAIDQAIGVPRLGLQLARIHDKIAERLHILTSMQQSIQFKLDKYKKMPLESYELWAKSLREGVQSGQLSLRDIYDTLLFLYQSNPETLSQKIKNGEISIPEELKMGIIAIADQEAKSVARYKEQKIKEEKEREERIKSKEIPEIYEEEIEPFHIGDIPGFEYQTISGYKTFHHWIGSQERSLEGIKKDFQELFEIQTSIENIQKYLGDLEKGQRSKKFLVTPEGYKVLDALKNFLEKSSLFIKRYATDIVQNGKINPKLMGTAGTIGNALIAVSLTRIYNVIKKTVDDLEKEISPLVIVEPAKTPVEQPSEVPVLSESEKRIKRMSELLWKAFENKFRLR